MLSTTRAHKAIVTLAALTYLFSTVGVAANKVLCFGVDGHVAIEYAENMDCTSFQLEKTQSSRIDLAVQSNALSNSHCGSCVDIPLGTVVVAKLPVPIRATSFANPYLAPGYQLGVFASRKASAAGPAAETATTTNATLANLRTVRQLT